MFREPQCSFESVATVLSILKIQQEYNGKCPRAVVDQDYDFEVYWEALFSAAEVVTFHEEIYQQTEESLFTFQDSAMTEYFQLCNEYGKRKHIRWKKNPYVKNAMEKVNQAMHSIDGYAYDYYFLVKPPTNYTPKLGFVMGPDFYGYESAIEALYCVIDFFKQAAKSLKEELSATVAPASKIHFITPMMFLEGRALDG